MKMNEYKEVQAAASEKELELGVVICRRCNNVYATIPTNGWKKIYGLCRDEACRASEAEGWDAE